MGGLDFTCFTSSGSPGGPTRHLEEGSERTGTGTSAINCCFQAREEEIIFCHSRADREEEHSREECINNNNYNVVNKGIYLKISVPEGKGVGCTTERGVVSRFSGSGFFLSRPRKRQRRMTRRSLEKKFLVACDFHSKYTLSSNGLRTLSGLLPDVQGY